MRYETSQFGITKAGQPVTAYTLHNSNGMSATILDYGCTVQSLIVPDKYSKPTDVVLGYNTVEEYEENGGFLGAFIGRVGNRIGKGSFELNGQQYSLVINDRGNHLHGGKVGFDKKIYKAQVVGDELVFNGVSPDGEEGYPGTLTFTVRYRLDDANTFHITYNAVSDKDTLFNPTNHSYFNLAGSGSVLDHELQIFARQFCVADENCLPTGELMNTEGSPFDFNQPKKIGTDILQPDAQLRAGNGYDHNFCLSDTGEWKKAARLYCAESGITMWCCTNLPGIQFYSANGLTERNGKYGQMGKRGAICLETQVWPDAIHHANFPSPVLKAGEMYVSQTAYHFSVD
ncbi:MAG: galactose mutarotase [Clostridia bacterium]|nr:galactose mutarotase [Clostridia bacterium]